MRGRNAKSCIEYIIRLLFYLVGQIEILLANISPLTTQNQLHRFAYIILILQRQHRGHFGRKHLPVAF
jgi:hypothetical protein